MKKFLGNKRDNLITIGLGIAFVIILFISMSWVDLFTPIIYIVGAIFVVLYIVTTKKELKKGTTNWFIVIGEIVFIVAGILAIRSYIRLDDLNNDVAARIENAVISTINDETKLDFESAIDKEESNFHTYLYITIGGVFLYCVGHIIQSNKKKTFIADNTAEKAIIAAEADNGAISSNASETKDYIFCPNCGAKLPLSSKFCKNCGTKI